MFNDRKHYTSTMAHTTDNSDESPPKKVLKTKSKRRAQKFRSEWLKQEDYSKWLRPNAKDSQKALCE